MADEVATSVGVGPPIPEAGLNEVLRAWSGQGQLWAALGAVADDVTQRRWTDRDVARRAHRVLLAELVPLLATWPHTAATWIDALPAESANRQVVAPAPSSGTSWPETRRRGWPPVEFLGKERLRTTNTLLISTLRWTLDRLAVIRADAVSVEPTVDLPVRRELDTALALFGVEPIRSATAEAPTPVDLHAVRGEGRPWGAVAAVASELATLDRAALTVLAERLVMPSPDLRWRLYHLGVLGELLLALRAEGAEGVSIRPLSGTTTGPAYTVKTAAGADFDLWFEASGAWSHYGRQSPYAEASAGVGGARRPIGADLMLMRLDTRALLIECKYTFDADGAARDGYEQAVAYAAEIRTRLAGEVVAVAVAPEGVIAKDAHTHLVAGEIHVAPPSALPDVVRTFLAA